MNDWKNVDNEKPPSGKEVLVAYYPKSNDGVDRKIEYSYCTAHYDGETWSVKDQLFYKERTCIVYFWQPIPQIP